MRKKPTPVLQAKPPLPTEKGLLAEKGSDLLLTVWVIAVGVFYFGGYFVPALGAQTEKGAALYAALLLASVLALVLRYLRRSPPGS